jgi:hypothetical protein
MHLWLYDWVLHDLAGLVGEEKRSNQTPLKVAGVHEILATLSGVLGCRTLTMLKMNDTKIH